MQAAAGQTLDYSPHLVVLELLARVLGAAHQRELDAAVAHTPAKPPAVNRTRAQDPQRTQGHCHAGWLAHTTTTTTAAAAAAAATITAAVAARAGLAHGAHLSAQKYVTTPVDSSTSSASSSFQPGAAPQSL